ncbi:MAG: hypothetical protein KC731_14230 [Myxococcales bacterium]|nr:hypothetical protein [Myxococcales bacterium]
MSIRVLQARAYHLLRLRVPRDRDHAFRGIVITRFAIMIAGLAVMITRFGAS